MNHILILFLLQKGAIRVIKEISTFTYSTNQIFIKLNTLKLNELIFYVLKAHQIQPNNIKTDFLKEKVRIT